MKTKWTSFNKKRKRIDYKKPSRKWWIKTAILFASIIFFLFLIIFNDSTRKVIFTPPENCMIDGVSYDWGAKNPNNTCQMCDVANSMDTWSNNDGAWCDDGILCNGINICSGGICKLDAKDPCPDNGNYCDGSEYCDAKIDECKSTGNPCTSDKWCAKSSKSCENWECITDDDCNDDVKCTLDQCDKGNNVCKHIPRNQMCDDGNACNGFEFCDGDGCSQPDPINSKECFVIEKQ